MLKQELKTRLKTALRQELGLKNIPEFQISEPPAHIRADLAANLPLSLGTKKGKDLQKLTKTVENSFGPDLIDVSIEQGFLNLTFSAAFWQTKLKKILKLGQNYGQLKLGQGKKVLIDFISNNPTGKLHLGNGRNAALGEALSRILENAGFQVTREYYVNNAKNSTQIKNLGLTVQGRSKQYSSPYLNQKIKQLKQKSVLTDQLLKGDAAELGYLVAQEIMKDVKKFLQTKLGIYFDNFFEEQELFEKSRVEKTKKTLQTQQLTYAQDGALWLKTSQLGDEKDRVLIRSNGQVGYFLPDIAYHQNKFDRGYDLAIDVFGADHQGHAKRLRAVGRALGWADKLKFIIIQLVRLQTKKGVQKMSKRAGTLVDLEELIDEVGADVVKFMLLSRGADTQMAFDLELAKKQSQENPVYYIQYAYARICSIFNKAQSQFPDTPLERSVNLELLIEPEEMALIKKITLFPELLADIAQNFQVQQLATYLSQLAGLFHHYYERQTVVQGDTALMAARLALLKAVQITLANGLNLLNISTPEEL